MNIYIARTPYHVMLAHAVYLATRGDDIRACLVYSGPSLDPIEAIITKSYWQDVLHFDVRGSAWALRKSNAIRHWVDQHFEGIAVDSLYVSDDMNWRDQVLGYHLQAKRKCLIEDGIGSYYRAKLNTKQQLFRNTMLRGLFAGIIEHYGAVSQSHGDSYFAVAPRAFPWVKNRGHVSIIKNELRQYILEAAVRCRAHLEPSEQTELYFLTQPFFESDLLTRDQDLRRHQLLASHFSNAKSVLVKKHPSEQDEMFKARVKAIASAIPHADILPSSSPIPAELLSIQACPGAIFVSFISTALINIKHLRNDLSVCFQPISKDDTISSLFSRLGIRQITREMP